MTIFQDKLLTITYCDETGEYAVPCLVHVRNLHPGANLHPGCKFAPGVYFWPCERCFKNLHPGVNLSPGANLHPGANCAHERKLYNFYIF